jgi:diguanylate cyclase (GGDEF)-like protein
VCNHASENIVASLVAINGKEIGRVFPLSAAPLLLGRGRYGNVKVDDPFISRRHAVIEVSETSEIGYRIRDLESMNGTWVDGRRLRAPRDVYDGMLVQIGPDLFEVRTHARDHERVDPLTRTMKKKVFFELLEAHLRESVAVRRNLALALFDIDHLRRFNDLHGHTHGDIALRAWAIRAKGIAGPGAIISRYGGNVFAMLVPDASLSVGANIARRIREATASEPFVHADRPFSLTVSAGVADVHDALDVCPESTGTPLLLAFVRAAEDRLSTAKLRGRNRVCVGRGDNSNTQEGSVPLV